MDRRKRDFKNVGRRDFQFERLQNKMLDVSRYSSATFEHEHYLHIDMSNVHSWKTESFYVSVIIDRGLPSRLIDSFHDRSIFMAITISHWRFAYLPTSLRIETLPSKTAVDR